MKLRNIGTLLVMTVASWLIAVGFNTLLIPHQLLSGGVSGISMIVGYATGWSIAILYFILNFPIIIWGWFSLGRPFVIWSVYSVVSATLFLQLVPIRAIATDPLLGAVFGGVIFGFGTGLALRYGGSSGGFDIVGSIIARKRDVPIGMLLFLLNAAVVAALGLMTGDWDGVMYSMLAIFTAGKVIDMIHIRHVKITAFIVTCEPERLLRQLLTMQRGVTVIRTRGGYGGGEQDMLMTVTTRYELATVRKMIRAIDPKAFVNIVETVGIMGQFRRS